jgi:hypothetical protein
MEEAVVPPITIAIPRHNARTKAQAKLKKDLTPKRANETKNKKHVDQRKRREGKSCRTSNR